MPVLIPENSRPGLSAVVLNRATCVVGARSRVHLPLASDQVSKAHALIVNDRNCVYIRDLASRNHTFVNDTAIRETPLEDADVIKFGDFIFRCKAGFRKEAAANSRQTAPAALAMDGMGQVPIVERTLVIGSRSDCEITLSGPDVSSAHAVIFERNGERFLRDLDSLSGTLLNGTTVRERQLKLGDRIEIAGTQMHYQSADAAIDEELISSDEQENVAMIEEPEEAALKVWDSGFKQDIHELPIAEPSLAAAVNPEPLESPEEFSIHTGDAVVPNDEELIAVADNEQQTVATSDELAHPPVTTQEISRLVGEVTEKAHELESAWQEYESVAAPNESYPGTEDSRKSHDDAPRPHRSAVQD
jgi:pSer/pThr/pTyr-binding forkhead associated (FHA) protein